MRQVSDNSGVELNFSFNMPEVELVETFPLGGCDLICSFCTSLKSLLYDEQPSPAIVGPPAFQWLHLSCSLHPAHVDVIPVLFHGAEPRVTAVMRF